MPRYTEPTVSFRLDEATHIKLQQLATARGLSKSALLRDWIEHADLYPVLSASVVEKLRYVASGRRVDPSDLLEDALRQAYPNWGWS